jgi:PASTA domain
MPSATVLPLLLLTFTLVSCADGTDQAAEAPRPTVTETVTRTPTAPATTATPDLSGTPRTGPRNGGRPTQGVIPDVVGMNHQAAQDAMQAAGYYSLLEEDATGQDRLLLIDRNWLVVEQEPKPGTRAEADTAVVLRSKKYTDP